MLMDPANAIVESEKLEVSTETCKKIVKDINAILDELPAVWEGVSANIFAQNNRQLIEMLNGIGRELSQISADIKVVATMP